MPTLTVKRHINAPVERVWEVLDDFGDIQRWNPGVTKSFLRTEGDIGHGSERTCELKPLGTIHERIVHHEPGERMTIHVYEGSRIPIEEGIADFTLQPVDGGTEVTVDYSYTPKPAGRLMGPAMKKVLARGFGALLGGLADESEKIASD